MPSSTIPFRFPGVRGVRCVFGTRSFGNVSLSHGLRENAVVLRTGMARVLGASSFCEVRQVHGTRTLFDPSPQDPSAQPLEEADGMATTRAGVALMIKTADCQPVLIAHSSGRIVAALHCGWKGNRQGYPGIAVEEICSRYGILPRDLWAVRGPSLGPAASEFVHFKEEWGDAFLPWYEEADRTVDLWDLTRSQLCAAGVPRRHVLGIDLCTRDNADGFFSYRHFRRCGSEDGRQGSFIWIE